MTLLYKDPHKQPLLLSNLPQVETAAAGSGTSQFKKLHTLMLGPNKKCPPFNTTHHHHPKKCPPFNPTHHHHPNQLCPPGNLTA
jgi:hypothetical protein